MLRVFISLVACVALLLGCKQSSTDAPKQTSAPVLSDDFHGFGPATNGARLADIVGEFGDPIYSGVHDGTNRLSFAIDPAPNVPRGLSGVSVFEKNGIVFNVRPITGDPAPFTKAQRAAAKTIVPREVLLKVGETAVTIHPKSAAPSQMNERSQTQLMLRAVFDLTDEDARAIQLLTATNVNKSVRLYLGQEFVSEFLIHEEIRTNTIEARFEVPGLPVSRLYIIRSPEPAEAPLTR